SSVIHPLSLHDALPISFLNLAACVSLLGQVTFERIRLAEREPGNWLTYSGNYAAHRHSPLDQVHPGTVSRLRPLWVYQTSSAARSEEHTSELQSPCNLV